MPFFVFLGMEDGIALSLPSTNQSFLVIPEGTMSGRQAYHIRIEVLGLNSGMFAYFCLFFTFSFN